MSLFRMDPVFMILYVCVREKETDRWTDRWADREKCNILYIHVPVFSPGMALPHSDLLQCMELFTVTTGGVQPWHLMGERTRIPLNTLRCTDQSPAKNGLTPNGRSLEVKNVRLLLLLLFYFWSYLGYCSLNKLATVLETKVGGISCLSEAPVPSPGLIYKDEYRAWRGESLKLTAEKELNFVLGSPAQLSVCVVWMHRWVIHCEWEMYEIK